MHCLEIQELINDKKFGKLSCWSSRVPIHQKIWPDIQYVPKYTGYEGQSIDNKKIASTIGAFAMLKSNGEIVTWGSSKYGGVYNYNNLSFSEPSLVRLSQQM